MMGGAFLLKLRAIHYHPAPANLAPANQLALFLHHRRAAHRTNGRLFNFLRLDSLLLLYVLFSHRFSSPEIPCPQCFA
jgi:hypothetical protein